MDQPSLANGRSSSVAELYGEEFDNALYDMKVSLWYAICDEIDAHRDELFNLGVEAVQANKANLEAYEEQQQPPPPTEEQETYADSLSTQNALMQAITPAIAHALIGNGTSSNNASTQRPIVRPFRSLADRIVPKLPVSKKKPVADYSRQPTMQHYSTGASGRIIINSNGVAQQVRTSASGTLKIVPKTVFIQSKSPKKQSYSQPLKEPPTASTSSPSSSNGTRRSSRAAAAAAIKRSFSADSGADSDDGTSQSTAGGGNAPGFIYSCIYDPSWCTYGSDRQTNVFQHVRRHHFKLPPTIKEQNENGIEDDRDARDYIRDNRQHGYSSTGAGTGHSFAIELPAAELTMQAPTPPRRQAKSPKLVVTPSKTPTASTSRASDAARQEKKRVLKYFEILALRCFVPGCQYETPSNDELTVHLENEHGVLPFRCLVGDCGKTYRSSMELGTHMSRVHTRKSDYNCPEPGCGSIISEHTSLYKHNLMWHAPGWFKCVVGDCPYESICRRDVFNHWRSDHGCQKCGSTFPDRGTLHDHQRTVHGRTKF